MEEYNQHISRMLLGNIHDGVLDTLPQPTMFGGKRMRQYVLPGSTDYSYPATLAVGDIDGRQRPGGQTLGGSFFKSFAKGLKSVASPIAHELAHEAIRGAIMGAGHSGGGHSGGYLIRDHVPPSAIPIVGGKKGFKGFIKDVKSGFKEVAPALKSASKALKLTKVGKEIYKDVLQPVGREALDVFKDAGKDALRQGIYSSVGQPMAGQGRRCVGGKKGFKGFIKDVKSGFKEIAPALKSASKALKLTKTGKEIYKDVLQPVGREALNVYKDVGKDALRQGIYKSVGADYPSPDVVMEGQGFGRRRGRGRPPKDLSFLEQYPEDLGGRRCAFNVKNYCNGSKHYRFSKGEKAKKKSKKSADSDEEMEGAGLITNNLGEFHHASTRVMPPALASYRHDWSLPAKTASGAGRKPSARGAIVSKVMKEKGLSLPQASKYVKDHGLY
jgi:hypothetical protein